MGVFFAKRRLMTLRIGVIIIAIFMFFNTPVLQNTSWYSPMIMLGLLLVLICVLGRIFTNLFMSNKRGKILVTEGMYSITRHPLYFFSFLGVLGIGLIYSSIVILLLLVVGFGIYTYLVIYYEEKYLLGKFYKEYSDYLKSNVPKFFPNRKLWKSREYIEINYKIILKTILDSSWFFLIACFIILLLALQNSGFIPTFLYIL